MPGRPASGSRRKRRWNACGSVWRNLVGKIDQVLWPEFSELDQALQAYLHQVTLRVIREEVYADASEAQEVSEALPPN